MWEGLGVECKGQGAKAFAPNPHSPHHSSVRGLEVS
jgi:hypothetical protein